MKLSQCRIALFLVWCAVFLGTEALLIVAVESTEFLKKVNVLEQCLNVSSVLLPLVMAFGAFWFGGPGEDGSTASPKLSAQRLVGIFGFTASAVIALGGALFYLFYWQDFEMESTTKAAEMFNKNVEYFQLWIGHLVAILAMAPIAFVLRPPSEDRPAD